MPTLTNRWELFPLHSTITLEEQKAAFRASQLEVRKIIISTNIAESSITVPDIKYGMLLILVLSNYGFLLCFYLSLMVGVHFFWNDVLLSILLEERKLGTLPFSFSS